VVCIIVKTIFLGGIHGVGKSFVCSNYLKDLQIKVYSASNLIRRYSSNIVDVNKKVDNISSNQTCLIDAIREIPKTYNVIILDGHFCLLDNQSNIVRISEEVLCSLNMVSIIVLYEDITLIRERLKQRDKYDFSIDLLHNIQEEELYYSKYLSQKYNLPYLCVKSSVCELNIKHFLKELKLLESREL